MANHNYKIREARASEKTEVYHLIQDHYVPDNIVTKIFFSRNKARYTKVEQQIREDSIFNFVKSSTCLVAIDNETSKIIGNIILDPCDIPQASAYKQPSSNLSLIEEFSQYLTNIYIDAKLYDKYPDIERSLKVRYVCVHKNHRGKGLAKALYQSCIDWARKNHYQLIYSLFTMIASKVAARNAGFVIVEDCDLAKVRDSTGMPVFEELMQDYVMSVMVFDVRE